MILKLWYHTFSSVKMDEFMQSELSDIFHVKLVAKNIVLVCPGTQHQTVSAVWCLFLKKHTNVNISVFAFILILWKLFYFISFFFCLLIRQNALELAVSLSSADLFRNIGEFEAKKKLHTVKQLVQFTYLLL